MRRPLRCIPTWGGAAADWSKSLNCLAAPYYGSGYGCLPASNDCDLTANQLCRSPSAERSDPTGDRWETESVHGRHSDPPRGEMYNRPPPTSDCPQPTHNSGSRMPASPGVVHVGEPLPRSLPGNHPDLEKFRLTRRRRSRPAWQVSRHPQADPDTPAPSTNSDSSIRHGLALDHVAAGQPCSVRRASTKANSVGTVAADEQFLDRHS